MAFTEIELNFIDENSELIDKGTSELKELIKKATTSFGSKSRMVILLLYTILGNRIFKVDTLVKVPKRVITGVLFNRTTCKAKGEPLLPAMFKNRTKVVLYNIQKGKIVDQKNYTLVSKQDLDNESLNGNYNLCILDKPEHINSAKACFDGTLVYEASVSIESEFLDNSFTICWDEVEATDGKIAKEAILLSFKNKLNNKIKDFNKVVDDVIDYIETQLIFKR